MGLKGSKWPPWCVVNASGGPAPAVCDGGVARRRAECRGRKRGRRVGSSRPVIQISRAAGAQGYNPGTMGREGRDGREDYLRAGTRSEFLRGQLRRWMDEVAAAGKTDQLFELEMWLQSFERFFQVKNQPPSERDSKQPTHRNWTEELRLVDGAILRVTQLCTSILTEEQLNQTRFDKYIEGYLKKGESVDPYVEKLLRQSSPEAGLNLLRESFDDIHLLLVDLVRLSRIPYATFMAVGRVIYREIRRSHLLALLIDKKFKPIHDQVRNGVIRGVIRKIESAQERRHAAKVFLEFFRLLHYLRYTDPSGVEEADLRDTLLLFSLIASETRLLLSYVENQVLDGREPQGPLLGLYDSFVYCIPLELKKVVNTELSDLSAAREAESVRTRVENSHGILKDCFQQSVVQLAQAFDPEVRGEEIFPDFMAKLDQSVELRDGLANLITALRDLQELRDEASATRMKEATSSFYDHHIKYLMYRDWSGFELFFIEILKCTSLPGLLQISHRFDTFLSTLFREVMKRSILQHAPPLSEAHRALEVPA
jgi:hypothetical protein